ncbi:MAG: hypothetical protein ACKVP0_01765 [Pirellulaceae bacterium]
MGVHGKVASDYERRTDVRYADAILDPATTRETLVGTLSLVTRHAIDEPFRVGVYQV